MNKKYFIGISYVSLWVIIWGSIGSLIDYPLLQAEIYVAGSIGQLLTFSITALLSIVIATFIYPKVLVKLLGEEIK